MTPLEDFELPDFDRPMDEAPSLMNHEEAMAAFEEIILSQRLREKEPLRRETIEPFVL